MRIYNHHSPHLSLEFGLEAELGNSQKQKLEVEFVSIYKANENVDFVDFDFDFVDVVNFVEFEE